MESNTHTVAMRKLSCRAAAALLLLFAALSLTSCRAERHAARPQPQPQETAEITETPGVPGSSGESGKPGESGEAGAPAHTRALTTMNFTATVDGISVNGQVRMAEDSVVWVTVSKFFELGRVKGTADSVWVSMPMARRSFAGTYAEASRLAKHTVTFDYLLSIVNAPDAEKRIEALAATLGFKATVRLGQPKQVDHLTFPL